MTIQLKIGPEAISSYRRLAYTPWHAIAEFVDNSTQSSFDHEADLKPVFASKGERLAVHIAYDRVDGLLRISDNAMGMSYAELQDALHVAKPPQNTKGRCKYGMGLKTAACWLGNVWEVRTKRLGDTSEHRITVDVERIASGSPDLPYEEIRNRPADDHYTIIDIRRHNRHRHTEAQPRFPRKNARQDKGIPPFHVS